LPTATGTYEVFTTNCSTTNSGNPLVHTVTHAGGSTNVGVCQNTTCATNAVNKWLSLGTFTLNAGTPYSVTLQGSTAAGSGPTGYACRSDAIKWAAININPPPQPGDFDSDGDVDLVDLDQFIQCVSGSLVPQTASDCADAKYDADDDVDHDDFGIFQRCYSGEGNMADPNCAN
jgi:hypothetical protein